MSVEVKIGIVDSPVNCPCRRMMTVRRRSESVASAIAAGADSADAGR